MHRGEPGGLVLAAVPANVTVLVRDAAGAARYSCETSSGSAIWKYVWPLARCVSVAIVVQVPSLIDLTCSSVFAPASIGVNVALASWPSVSSAMGCSVPLVMGACCSAGAPVTPKGTASKAAQSATRSDVVGLEFMFPRRRVASTRRVTHPEALVRPRTTRHSTLHKPILAVKSGYCRPRRRESGRRTGVGRTTDKAPNLRFRALSELTVRSEPLPPLSQDLRPRPSP